MLRIWLSVISRRTWCLQGFIFQFSKYILYFQFSAGVDPGDIKIIETDASGAVRETAGLTFGENEIIPGEFQEDLEDERGGWDNKLDFLFSCISVSVGLGSKFLLFLISQIQCNPDLVTLLVCQKNVTKSRGVTK